jgi:hypothetical protein
VTLDRTFTFAALRLLEEELFPAPPVCGDGADLFATAASEALLNELNASDGIVAVHGLAGIGKTSALLVALREHGAGVLYDCYAGGRGLRPGQERFEYPVCFTQVINELEGRFNTGMLATTRLDYRPLLGRLIESVGAAAKKAGQFGKRLVIAFDAVDNAVEQKRRTIGDTRPSFVQMLLQIEWPPNCVVVVSFRSENERDVLDAAGRVRFLKIDGFTQSEIRELAATHGALVTGSDLLFLWKRTAGNPRVAAKVLDEIAANSSVNAKTLIDTTARLDAFAYYDQEQQTGRRLADERALSLLALLFEIRQPPSLATLAQAAGERLEDVRHQLAGLQFGVRITSDDAVEWVDQDFLDWVGERLATWCLNARGRLADFCAAKFEQDAYARWNLSYHFLQANRYQQILEWWAVPGRLDAQRAAAQPHEERVLNDLHALVVASLELARDEEAVLWLFRAADLAGGRDAFALALADHLDVTVAADITGLIDEDVRGGSTRPAAGRSGAHRASRRLWHRDAASDFSLAAALSMRPDRRDDAARIFARAVSSRRQEEARFPEASRHGLGRDVWEEIARYHCRMEGLSIALRWISRGGKSPWALDMAVAAAGDWITSNEKEPLALILKSRLPAAIQTAACLGVLSANHSEHSAGAALRQLSRPVVRAAAASVERALVSGVPLRTLADQRGFPPQPVGTALVAAAEQLLAAGFSTEVRKLTSNWSVPSPRFWSDSSIREFLRWNALREASGGIAFDPNLYEPPPRENTTTKARPGKTDDDDRERDQLRQVMGTLYPALQLRARAWAGRDNKEIPDTVRRILSSSIAHMRPAGISHLASPAIVASWLLEAAIALPSNEGALVDDILAAVDRALQGTRDDSEAVLADVLSHDKRYIGIADRLIRKEVQRCRPPAVPAIEAVARLLALYFAANRVDQSLARDLIEQARDVAGEIDSLAGDRGAALERAAAAACERAIDNGLDASILDRLCALVTYWRGIDKKSVSVAWALELLARLDVSAAVERAWMLDEGDLCDIFDGAVAVATGALSSQVLSAAEVWPIIALHRESPRWIKFTRDVIERLAAAADAALVPAFSAAALATRRQITEEGSESIGRIRDFLDWIDRLGLGSTSDAQKMKAILGALRTEPAPNSKSVSSMSFELPTKEELPLFLQESAALLGSSPRDALSRLNSADRGELALVRATDLLPLIERLRESLPLSDRIRLGEIIERWGSSSSFGRQDAIGCLDKLLSRPSDPAVEIPQEVRSAIRDSISRLIDPDTLAYAASDWSPDSGRAIFDGAWGDPAQRRITLLRRIAVHLPDLQASSIFRLASRIAELLDDAALVRVTHAMIEETFEKAPICYTPVVFGREASRGIPHLLALCLSHQRLDVRWRALDCVVHGLSDVDESTAPTGAREAVAVAARSLLAALLEEFSDESRPRWVTTREWLAFAFDHVAHRTPWVLTPAVLALMPHALSRQFPHVKIREHLRSTLLSLEIAGAASLKPREHKALNEVNRPVGETDETATVNVHWPEGEVTKDAFEISSYDWDTNQYWYDAMLRSFAGDAAYLKNGAFAAAKFWAGRLGVTDSMVQAERTDERGRYRWQETSNRHGSEPHVELLDKYVARQALFLIAGTLVDQIPIKKTRDYDDRWNDFLRYRSRGADSELTGRWIDAPPAEPENYQIFAAPLSEWRETLSDEDYLAELTSGVADGWIVVAGDRRVSAWDRNFTSHIDTALVDSRTASSLVRIFEAHDSDRYSGLPTWDVHYDCTVKEAEGECRRPESKWAHIERADRFQRNAKSKRDQDYGSRFSIVPTEIAFHQELPLHETDPLWRGSSRHYSLPTPAIVIALGWTRVFGRPEWCNEEGSVVARYEVWSQENGRRWSYGHRLLVRVGALETFHEKIGIGRSSMELVWSVRISREILEAGERVGEIDLGTKRAFLWSGLRGFISSTLDHPIANAPARVENSDERS